MSGYKVVSKNVSDYICFNIDKLFLIECKTHSGASIPFDAISQYDTMLNYVGIPGVRAGIVVWLYQKEDAIFYIPISSIKQMKEDGLKSVGIKTFESGKYKIIKVPSKKLKTFYESDYSCLMGLEDFD